MTMDLLFRSTSTPSSPVTWHVALWVLFTLAISSMAQPAGNLYGINSLKRYRIYFCSSPILCVTDALSMLIRFPWTSCALHISPIKAARLVLMARNCEKELGQDSWPRWIFFIIGTLPAAIKLCSFSGLPWTQAWGLMFAFSYLILEGFFFASKLGSASLASSIKEELGYTSITWELEGNKGLRVKIEQLGRYQEIIDIVCLMLALLGHSILSVWTIEDIWLSASFLIQVEPIVSNIAQWISIAVDFFLTIALLSSLVLLSIGFKEFLSRWLSFGKFAFMFILQSAFSLLARKFNQGSRKTIDRWNDAMTILIVIAGVLFSLRKILMFMCIRLPALGRIMLLTTTQHTSAVRTEGSQFSIAQESSAERDSTVQIPLHEVEAGVEGFLFFCFNVGLCVLWYAFRYNPSGTVNPTWTDIFG